MKTTSAAIALMLVVSSCGAAGIPDPDPAGTEISTTSTAGTHPSGDRSGLMGQVDRARTVAGDLEDRNGSITP